MVILKFYHFLICFSWNVFIKRYPLHHLFGYCEVHLAQERWDKCFSLFFFKLTVITVFKIMTLFTNTLQRWLISVFFLTVVIKCNLILFMCLSPFQFYLYWLPHGSFSSLFFSFFFFFDSIVILMCSC